MACGMRWTRDCAAGRGERQIDLRGLADLEGLGRRSAVELALEGKVRCPVAYPPLA
jgi:hypothetical protein